MTSPPSGAKGGGETAKDPSGWSPDTLKSYIERVIDEHDRRYAERFVSQEKATQVALNSAAEAVAKAEANSEKWRANANEWRAAMNDRERDFMSRDQSDAQFDNLEKQILELKKYRDTTEGRTSGLSAGWGFLIGAVGLVGAIIAIVLNLSQ